MSHESPHWSSDSPTRPNDDGVHRLGAEVRFRDPRGREWQAREIDATIPGRSTERCLVIESMDTVRRVWNYPSDWRDRPLHELVALLDAG
jgi:hypothetical protein